MSSRTTVILGLCALAAAGAARAGCLAPTDAAVDGAGAVGPFWGNESGELLYARNVTGTSVALLVRPFGGAADQVARQGESNPFTVGGFPERWTTFHSGTINETGDLAFVASTVLSDDEPSTVYDDTVIERRGVYARRGNTLYRVARFGGASPILDPFAQPVPWASIFDAAITERSEGPLRVHFSAQLGGTDGRTGLFRWSELNQVAEVLLLEGEVSPTGGLFTNIGRLRMNLPGDTAFFATEQLGGQGAVDGGIYLLRDNGTLIRLVRFGVEGDPAPGGGRFGILNDFDIDDQGTVHFAATLTGGGSASGLFRVAADLSLSAVAREGDPSSLGGTLETFASAKVRTTPDGALVLGVQLSLDVDGEGVFSIPAGTDTLAPLANPLETLGVASLGAGRAAYQTDSETHMVAPADGSEQGPDDFRIVKIDVNNFAGRQFNRDSLRFDGRFRLPPVGTGPGRSPPAVFRVAGTERFTPDTLYAAGELVRIVGARAWLSDGPGNNFEFGIALADTSPTGTLTVNGIPQNAPKVKIGKTGDQATWSFRNSLGRGKFSVDLAAGTFSLKLSGGNINPNYFADNLNVQFTLRSEDDVAQQRPDSAVFFHRALRIDATQAAVARVTSTGEGVPGGTVFVDTVDVKRKLKARKGVAAPEVSSDTVTLAGAVRICPGSTPPGTPTLGATLRFGDLALDGISLQKIGKSGSRYRFRSGPGDPFKADFRVDAGKGTFTLKASGVPPLSQLVDADFSGTHATNDSRQDVGGMVAPFTLTVNRVYDISFDVPMVRKAGGKTFSR